MNKHSVGEVVGAAVGPDVVGHVVGPAVVGPAVVGPAVVGPAVVGPAVVGPRLTPVLSDVSAYIVGGRVYILQQR
jgi:hypothetical protein